MPRHIVEIKHVHVLLQRTVHEDNVALFLAVGVLLQLKGKPVNCFWGDAAVAGEDFVAVCPAIRVHDIDGEGLLRSMI